MGRSGRWSERDIRRQIDTDWLLRSPKNYEDPETYDQDEGKRKPRNLLMMDKESSIVPTTEY